MPDLPHDFSVGVGTAPVTADPVWRFTCTECNWDPPDRHRRCASSPAVPVVRLGAH